MEFFGHRPNKRAGQNFLKRQETVDKVVDSLQASVDTKVVLEIGPGTGSITRELCKRFERVIAIEKDKRLVALWEKEIGLPDNLTLLQADATQFDYAKLRKEIGSKLAILGNLPFNVSTLILQRLFHEWPNIDYAHLTFQKEVAQRLLAEPSSKDYGSLTLLTQTYCKAHKSIFIGKQEYFPVPKVDSCVVGFKFLDKPLVEKEHLRSFEDFVRQGFLYRRKTLLNGLKQSKRFSSSVEAASDFLLQNSLSPTVRLETLSHQTIYQLFIHCISKETQ